jgi:hypothetical protein
VARGRQQAYNSRMNRTLRMLVGGLALAVSLVVVATVIAAPSERGQNRRAPVAASHQPQGGNDQDEPADEADGQPSAKLLDRLVANLADAGITTDADTIAALAADYGVGGAVRLLAWSSATGMTTDELAAMFDSGVGWGEIAAELNADDQSLDLHPGISGIMGNGGPPDGVPGLGRERAPGQQDK